MSPISSAEIQAALEGGRVVEAGTLLTMHGEELDPEERLALESEREQRCSRATSLVTEGEALEAEGWIEEARHRYQQAAGIASDFPGIQEHCKRVEEALELASAVRLRSKRIRAQAEKTGRSKKKNSSLAPIAAGILLLGIGGTGAWWYLGQPGLHRPSAPSPASPSLPAAQQQPAQQPENISSNAALPPDTETLSSASGEPKVVPPAPKAPLEDGQTVSQHASPAVEAPSVQPIAPIAAQNRAEVRPTPPEPELPAEADSVRSALLTVADKITASAPQPDTPKNKLEQAPVSAPPPAPTPVSAPKKAEQAPAQATPLPQKTAPKTYTVQPGDSLSKIAKRLFCDQDAWRQLYTQNRDRVKDPDLLIPGMQIQISGVKNNCEDSGKQD
nr:LysM peptidoglycan-binding domain-containing protein [uncultured Desulfobulbus sp.]